MRGTIKYITNYPLKNEEYIAEVDFDRLNEDNDSRFLLLRNGVIVEAEVITTNATLLQRLYQSLTRGIK